MISSKPPAQILVSVATYKERENLERLAGEILQQLPHANLLIIDDNSPDGTGELADRLATKDPRIRVIHRSGKLGLGTAILTGMKYAMENGYKYFLNMDADFSHSPKYLGDLVSGMEENDIMIGSRYIAGGGTVNWPASRKLMSRGVNFLVRVLMRIPARDTSGGYRCYRVPNLEKAQLEKLMSYGYSFQQEVLYRCWKSGARIGETPIIFEDRTTGASKANIREIIRSLSVLLYLGFNVFFGNGPR